MTPFPKFRPVSLLLCLAMLIPATAGYARKISVENAQAIASTMLVKPDLAPVGLASRADVGERAYYVFRGEGNKGFAIIGADDRIPRLIGYSDKNNFNPDNLPPQLSAMLDSLNAALARMDASVPVHASWKSVVRM